MKLMEERGRGSMVGEYLGSITKTTKTKTTEQNRMGSYNLAYKSNYTNSTNNTDNEK